MRAEIYIQQFLGLGWEGESGSEEKESDNACRHKCTWLATTIPNGERLIVNVIETIGDPVKGAVTRRWEINDKGALSEVIDRLIER